MGDIRVKIIKHNYADAESIIGEKFDAYIQGSGKISISAEDLNVVIGKNIFDPTKPNPIFNKGEYIRLVDRGMLALKLLHR